MTFLKTLLIIYLGFKFLVCVWFGHFYALAQVWRSEDNFQVLVLSFHLMDSEDQTQIFWNKHL